MHKNPPFQRAYASHAPPNAWIEQYTVHPLQRPETESSAALEVEAPPSEFARPDDVPIEMVTGMTALLNLHNTEEIRILCNELDLRGSASKGERIKRIFDAILSGGEKSYRDVLAKVWEGIQIEYLRTLGKKVRSYKLDPRFLILQHWTRRGEKEREGWTRVYVPTTDGLEEESLTDDRTIVEFLKRIRAREKAVKAAEKEIRRTGDYTGTVDMLDGMSRLRQVEEEFRKTVIKELENSRDELLLCRIREKATYFQMKREVRRRNALEKRACHEVALHESAFQVYYDMASLELEENHQMGREFLGMLDRARDEHEHSNHMREENEESKMMLAHAESRLTSADWKLREAREKEKRARLALEDTSLAFAASQKDARRRVARLRATNGLYMQMITDAEMERIAAAHGDMEVRNELREQASMAFEEVNQRRTEELRIMAAATLAAQLEADAPKKKTKGGKKKGGKKKGGKKKGGKKKKK